MGDEWKIRTQRQKGERWSCVKVNLCFHDWRHASKPVLTHMLETLTQASKKLICFRSVWRSAHTAEEKLSALSSYTFLCFSRRPWYAQAKLTLAVWGGSSQDVQDIQNWNFRKLLRMQVWLHERHVVSLCRKLQSSRFKQEKNMHLSLYCEEFWLFKSIVSSRQIQIHRLMHLSLMMQHQCKTITLGFTCDYLPDFVLTRKQVISCSVSCSFITFWMEQAFSALMLSLAGFS